MRLQSSRDTGPETALRSALHRMGLRFRLHRPVEGLPRRKVDIAFPSSRVAVFVDGCFWHGCAEHGRAPGANQEYWIPKIERTRGRDAETTAHLETVGWTVVRVWEHEDVLAAAERVRKAVRR